MPTIVVSNMRSIFLKKGRHKPRLKSYDPLPIPLKKGGAGDDSHMDVRESA